MSSRFVSVDHDTLLAGSVGKKDGKDFMSEDGKRFLKNEVPKITKEIQNEHYGNNSFLQKLSSAASAQKRSRYATSFNATRLAANSYKTPVTNWTLLARFYDIVEDAGETENDKRVRMANAQAYKEAIINLQSKRTKKLQRSMVDGTRRRERP